MKTGLLRRTRQMPGGVGVVTSRVLESLKAVNVNLIMYNYDHLRMYNYSVSPS